ncbi:GNAT family N-acetyltransferase [Klebsiella variicola]|uniref:GNAT family N-acetyltransferase n=1 Tax=Klebsiella variicola TaxID=244366 RepID=UPI0034E4748D
MVEEVILPQEKQQILDEINGWLNTVYPYKKSPAYLCDSIEFPEPYFRIMAQRKKYDIYIRFGKTWISDDIKSIVVARIGFDQQRSRRGTNLLKLLVRIAKLNNYQSIGIESVNQNSKAFALTFDFEEHTSSSRNYVISTDKLSNTLDNK